MKKYFIGLITFLSLILIGLIIIFIMVLNGTITKETLGITDSSLQNFINTGSATAITENINPETYIPSPSEEPKRSRVVVLDPGHGKMSSSISEQDKLNEMWLKNASTGTWGEWRHWKSGAIWHDCECSGCSKRVPRGGSCWYRMSDGDRNTEPEINLNNAKCAKDYLSEMGYEVRMTRTTSEENPSMTKRLVYCYPNQDTTAQPDADIFVCLHSNAGGGSGTAYMSLSGTYDQDGILLTDEYIRRSNLLGESINSEIVAKTSLTAFADGKYSDFPTTILFCKSPIPIAYLEIGFFDNSSDLNILKSESEQIGQAIAIGIDKYFNDIEH